MSEIYADKIPEELKALDHWVCWEYVEREGKTTKPPLNSLTGGRASSTDTSTWTSFGKAVEAFEGGLGDGIGFVVCEDDPYVGIDLDHCRDSETGEVEESAEAIVSALNSYTEVTVSEEGIRIWVKGTKPEGGSRKGNIEIYDRGRFFTLTGKHLEVTPAAIEERQAELEALHASVFAKDKPLSASVPSNASSNTPTIFSIESIINFAKRAKNGAKFTKLFEGNWEEDYESQSEADLAFCSIAGFYASYDPGAIDAILRRSGLYREKWDKSHFGDGRTYGEATIETAISNPILTDQKETIVLKAHDYIDEAKASGNPTECIFSNPPMIQALALVRYEAPAEWALIKHELKGDVNLNDLTRATGQVSLRLVSDDERPNRLPVIIEDDYGYQREKNTQAGPIRETISNFRLVVRERLTMPEDDEVLSADLIINGRYKRRLDLTHTALTSSRDLLNHIPTPDVVWLGTDRDVQILRGHLLEQDAVSLQGTSVVGRHKNLIVLPRTVVSSNGQANDPPLRFVNRSATGWMNNLLKEWPCAEDQQEAIVAVYKHLARVNEVAVVLPLIGWYFVLPWADMIRNSPTWGGFPHFVMSGGAGAGKTAYSELLMQLCGFLSGAEPFSLPGTRFTRLERYASSNLIPVFFDEYRTGAMRHDEISAFHSELRSLYGGEDDERGRPNLTAKTYKLRAPIVIAGEDRPRDPALDHRLVIINPSRVVMEGKKAYSDAFNRLVTYPLEAFALPYWSWALGQDNWLELLEVSRIWIHNWADEQALSIPVRILNNLAIVKFGLDMYCHYGSACGVKNSCEIDDQNIEKALRSLVYQVMPDGENRDALDEFMVLIATMISNDKLRYGCHFTTKGQGNIVLRLEEIHPEAKRYARETCMDGDVYGKDLYRHLIKEKMKSNNSYVLETTTVGDFEKSEGEGRRKLRGVLIEPAALEEQLGIDREIWLEHGDRSPNWDDDE